MGLLPMRGVQRWRLPLFGVFTFTIIVVWLLLFRAVPPPTVAASRIVIALPTQIGSASILVAADRMFFAEQRVTAVLQPHALGKQALEAMMQGQADLAVVADTPFMFAVNNGADIATVAAIFGSRKSMAIVARRDTGIAGATELSGKRLGTVFGTNAQFFLDTFLLANRVAKASVDVVDMKPGVLTQALLDGTVDAVTVWPPDLPTLAGQLGANGVTMYGEELFVYRFLLVGKRDYLATHDAEVRKLLTAIEAGNQFIHAQPAEAKAIVGKAVGLAPALMANNFDPNDFSLSLDQSLLLALGDQTRWAMRRGLIQGSALPDYLRFIRHEPLAAVLPSSVKIIR